jgi:hypothetical protein
MRTWGGNQTAVANAFAELTRELTEAVSLTATVVAMGLFVVKRRALHEAQARGRAWPR